MHALERRSRVERRVRVDAEQCRTLDDAGRAEAFSAAKQRVAHGGAKPAALIPARIR